MRIITTKFELDETIKSLNSADAFIEYFSSGPGSDIDVNDLSYLFSINLLPAPIFCIALKFPRAARYLLEYKNADPTQFYVRVHYVEPGNRVSEQFSSVRLLLCHNEINQEIIELLDLILQKFRLSELLVEPSVVINLMVRISQNPHNIYLQAAMSRIVNHNFNFSAERFLTSFNSPTSEISKEQIFQEFAVALMQWQYVHATFVFLLQKRTFVNAASEQTGYAASSSSAAINQNAPKRARLYVEASEPEQAVDMFPSTPFTAEDTMQPDMFPSTPFTAEDTMQPDIFSELTVNNSSEYSPTRQAATAAQSPPPCKQRSNSNDSELGMLLELLNNSPLRLQSIRKSETTMLFRTNASANKLSPQSGTTLPAGSQDRLDPHNQPRQPFVPHNQQRKAFRKIPF